MKKILITNNSLLINKNYDIIFTDSPYVFEKNNSVKYLDTLLDKELNNKIEDITNKGFAINKKIIECHLSQF